MLERFRNYKVSREVLSYVEKATECSEQMIAVQIHAVSLMKSVYPLPPIPGLAALPEIPLTEAELAMSPEERVTAAKQAILAGNYLSLRYQLVENIDDCDRTLQQEFEAASQKTERYVYVMRLLLWTTLTVIMVILSVTFVMFFELIVKPVRKYSEAIDENRSIKQVRAIAELRRLVNAHNNQWERRNKLEAILRTAAETDSLTGLQNRYCMERDLIENENEDGSMGVLLFDVNFLKQTNDTKGHLAGDQLIRTAADCIRECFGTANANNCYRIGGDEFVALLRNCSEDEIKTRVGRFALATERENITVSVGYAYDEKTNADSFKTLMEKADRQMYEQKRLIHERSRAAGGGRD